jgi:glutamine---fructose-6-phosphate transaminase (isomerizing)
MTTTTQQPAGTLTRAEIFSQPAVWTSALRGLQRQTVALRKFFEDGSFDAVLFTGCGSTYYLSLAAATVFQAQTGIPARGLPASEIWLDPAAAYSAQQRNLLIAVSRSGSTTETVQAVEAFLKRGHGAVLTLSCYPDAPLAKMGTVNLLFPEAQEESVAQTRAFSTLYIASAALGFIFTGDEDGLAQMNRLPNAGKRLLENYAELASALGRDAKFERFYFLGSGARYGLACEVSLKMKEMSLSHSEPFHFMEFRHGPMSMVNEQTLLVGMVSDERRDQEMKVLKEMKAHGASILALAESDADVVVASGVCENGRAALYLPVIQYLAFEHSLGKGLNPDRPNNLTAVIELA